MSYCRWSSCDFQSDLYVYESVGGFWSVNVAGNRVVKEHEDPLLSDYVPIVHPDAGKSFECGTPGEAADLLQRLSDEGLFVPDWVIPDLRKEQAELDALDPRP